MRTVIDYLSKEDRDRYIDAIAKMEFAESGNPSVALLDAQRWYREYYDLHAEIRSNYEIDDDIAILIEPGTGAITETAGDGG